MTKLTAAVFASLVACSAAFAPQKSRVSKTALSALTGFEEYGGQKFDPMGLSTLGSGEAFDTFPNCFPDEQFLKEAEIKHGRQAMLAWTGVWATSQVSCCSLIHITSAPFLTFLPRISLARCTGYVWTRPTYPRHA